MYENKGWFMKSRFGMVAACAVLALSSGISQLRAEQGNTNSPPATYSGYVFDQYQWVEAPNMPGGVRMALLENTPSKAGLYTVRYKFPAGYRIPLSWLSTDERITVISGLLNVGISPDYSQSSSKAIPAGGFAFIPAKMRFTAWTDIETVIQVHGIGPSEIHAVYAKSQ